MNRIEEKNLVYISGGTSSVTGSIINSFTTCMKFVLELGRSFGSAIRRGKKGQYCAL